MNEAGDVVLSGNASPEATNCVRSPNLAHDPNRLRMTNLGDNAGVLTVLVRVFQVLLLLSAAPIELVMHDACYQ